MQRSVGGYAQQDSMQDGPGSTRGSSHATRRLNPEFANGNKTIRKRSNDSSTQPDSAVDFNSPPGAEKDPPVEDEAIEIPVHGNEEVLPLRASMGNNADPMFALLAYMEQAGSGQVN